MTPHEATGSQHFCDMYTPLMPAMGLTYILKERVGLRYWFHGLYNDQTPPTGGPVTDVARFMVALLDKNGGPLLQPATAALMRQGLEEGAPRTLGWAARCGARPFLFHPGGGPGFSTLSFAFILPKVWEWWSWAMIPPWIAMPLPMHWQMWTGGSKIFCA